MTRTGWLGVLLGAALVVLSGGTARATVMVEVPLDRLIRESDAIVLGRVEQVGVQMVMQKDSVDPHTLTRVRVESWLKGAQNASVVTIRELGGEHRGGGMWIEGTPRYAVGEEVVVFLIAHPEHPDQYRTYAMAQGKLTVRRGVPGVPDMVQRDLEGIGFAQWADGAMTVEHVDGEPAMQLDELLAHIRRTQGPLVPPRGGVVGGER